MHEGQAGFRINRSCMDNVYTLNEIVQGRLSEDKKTYASFLDIQKPMVLRGMMVCGINCGACRDSDRILGLGGKLNT